MVPTSASAAVRIAATTGDLAALAEAVGGDHVRVDALSAPTEDTHYVDPRPDKIVVLSRADLLIATGLDLEVGWLPQLQVNSRNRNIQVGGEGYFDASSHIDIMGAAQGPVDRSQGDVHPAGNPHYTRDPRRMASVAEALGDKLATIDPEHADYYRAQAQEFADRARRVAQQARERFDTLSEQQRKLVIYHKSFEYLTDLLNLSIVATIEPRPGIEPNPRHVSTVLRRMRAQNASVIIQEEYYPRNVADTLANLTDAELVVIPAQTRFKDGQSYFEHFEEVADALYNALSSGGE
jgi:zinc/manganese transport system substrate-binding protein